MGKGSVAITALNRGLVARLGLARIDLKRMALSAATQINWVSRVLGSMMLRPGLKYLGAAPSRPKMIPFIFSTDDTAIVELTHFNMRVWVDDQLVNRPAVSTIALTNANFVVDVAGWTSLDEAGAVSSWNGGLLGLGVLQLLGNGTAAAIREQVASVSGVNLGIEHALNITIARGPVLFRVGTSSGGEQYIAETTLLTGVHSLVFTPIGSGNVYIRFYSRLDRVVWVDSCNLVALFGLAPGTMNVASPWTTDKLRTLNWDQSGDVLFIACKGQRPSRIERRAKRSWSIVDYEPEDGPFRAANTGLMTLTPSALTGNITLTSSQPFFRTAMLRGLIRITSKGQRVTASLVAENTFTNTIEVTGVGESRRFTITRSGTWVATVTLQRSVGITGIWEDVTSYTDNDSVTFADELDNQIIFYRIGVKTGNYTSGTVVVTLNFQLGSITGIVRPVSFNSSTSVGAEVLKALGGTDATDQWAEGAWSNYRGFPSSVALHEGRLWWSGKNGIWGSVSDAFDSFDATVEGDAGPISRTIGAGPVDDINWLLSMQRLVVGAEGAEFICKSTAFDEPMTPSNFNIKSSTTQGSTNVPAVKLDGRAIFVQRSGRRVYEMVYDVQINDYTANDLSAMVPDIGAPQIVAMAIQRQPDTRIHCVRSNGTVALATIDHAENVLAWQEVETDGIVEDVVVLPGIEEDAVYYMVQRTLGNTGVATLTVTAGSGYTTRPTVVFAGGAGTNASATIDLTLVSFAVSAAGAGYVKNEVLTFVGGTRTISVQLIVESVSGTGGVLTATIFVAGDYTVIPANAVATTTNLIGAGCTITATWGLGYAVITSTGSAYSSAPTATLSGGGGTGGAIAVTIAQSSLIGHYLEKWALESECRGLTLNKQADAFIEFAGTINSTPNGFVSALAVVEGAGYVATPTLVFTGGGSINPLERFPVIPVQATATIGLSLVQVGVASVGSGYSRGDVLTLTGGTYTRPAQVQVLDVFGSGQILGGNAISIVDPGEYVIVPAAAFSSYAQVTGGTGSGASIWPIWGLSPPVITSGGSGYIAAPTVTVVGAPSGVTILGGPPVAGTVSASVTIGFTSTGDGSEVISGLSHLEGKEVVVWGDAKDFSPDDAVTGIQRTYTVFGGQITLDQSIAAGIVGLPYTGTWKSTKLAYVAENGETALTQRKQIKQVGFVMADTHSQGLKFGPDFVDMSQLPNMQVEQLVGYDAVYEAYDFEPIEFPSKTQSDARLCLLAQAPRPVTMMGIVIVLNEHGKS